MWCLGTRWAQSEDHPTALLSTPWGSVSAPLPLDHATVALGASAATRDLAIASGALRLPTSENDEEPVRGRVGNPYSQPTRLKRR